ncbi:MAG: sigma-70 family RNA polymerase sigma factor [Propionibacteriales bacterium]|nr:sigma-70 family RNA polymerase sigma factor [Propionibacteriales bacterium]
MDDHPDERVAAFENVARELIEPLRRFLARRTDPATADDVLAEVLLVLWRRWDQWDGGPEAALPWSYGVARNCLANAERGARRQRRLAAKIARVDPPGETGPESPGTTGLDAALDTGLEQLPPADAELLRLWAWEDLSPAEIATVLGITPNAASIRLHRAREKLRSVLRKPGPGAGHDPVNERSKQ